jgi:hypothetical protein
MLKIHATQLNDWHLQLAILADAIDYVLQGIEEPQGLSATAHVLKNRLQALVESCPFPAGDPSPMFPFDDGFMDADLEAEVLAVEMRMKGRDHD